MDCRLICLDIDGTLLNSRHEITENVKVCIQKVLKCGIPVVFLSAQVPRMTTFLRDRLEMTDSLTCFEGGFPVKLSGLKDVYLEVIPKGIGKREVFLELCKLFRVSSEQVLGVGDNDNDMGMLEAAGVGVAMGNAHEWVKACSDFVTKSNDEDGVAYAIEKFVLAPKAKLVAVDMDGTALEPDKTLSPVTLAAVREAAEAGAIVVPASGRTYDGIPEELLKLGLPYVISANGGAITDTKTGKHIYENEILFESAALLLSELKSVEGVLYIQYQDHYYQDRTYVEKGKQYHPYAGLPEEGIVEDLLKYVLENQIPLQKAGILLFDEETEQKVLDMQARYPELKVLKTDHLCVEFNAETASKGDALMHLCQMLHIGPEEVMAIGDSENDLTMLQFAGKSVAMANAMDSVGQAAVYQTKSNAEHGVAWAFRYIL